jgi:hypothetical protein
MRKLWLTAGVFSAFIYLWTGSTLLVSAQTNPSARATLQKETVVTAHATGTFEVKLTPQTAGPESPDDTSKAGNIGRMSIDKQFHGELDATSRGQMLAASTAVKGSAGYVAIEEVSGTLRGRSGTFLLQHSGTMDHGTPHLIITVVPDSGTGQLVGLSGTMNIKINAGKHSYDFEYTLSKLD